MNNLQKTLALLSVLSILLSSSGCVITANPRTTKEPTSLTVTKPTTTAAAVSTTVPVTETPTTVTKAVVSSYPYSYAGFNPVTTDMSVPFNEILLNRNYILPDGYVPDLAEAVKGTGIMLDYRVAPQYQRMYNAALADGITLTPISGYRSFNRQKTNFENRIALYQSQGLSKEDAAKKASEIILLPGASEHNAGLAMDIGSLTVDFENTDAFRWLQENAYKYGFILRYPKDKTHITKITYEPWHYRYVGTEIAKELKESGMTLEEYLGKVG